MTLTFLASCHHLPNAMVTGVHHRTWFLWYWGLNTLWWHSANWVAALGRLYGFTLYFCVLSERQHGITSDTCHQGKILNSLSVKGRKHFPLMVPSSVKCQRKTFTYGDHMRRINAGKCERNDLSAWTQTYTFKKFEENLMKPRILHSSDCLFGIYG